MQAAARKVKGADAAAGAGLPERFRRSAILVRDLAQIKSADNQQVQTNREIVRIPVGWKHSQQTGAVKGCIVYNSTSAAVSAARHFCRGPAGKMATIS